MRIPLNNIKAVIVAAALGPLLLAGFYIGSNERSSSRVAVDASEIRSTYKDSYRLTTAANQDHEVIQLGLPAGNYSISAKMGIDAPQSRMNEHVRCLLMAGGDFDETVVSHDGTISYVSLALNVVHSFNSPGYAVLTCGHRFIQGDTFLRFVKITAVRAVFITNSPAP